MFLLMTMLSVYLIALRLERYNEEMASVIEQQGNSAKAKKEIKKKYGHKKKIWIILAALINIGVLCAVKYTSFVTVHIYQIFGTEDIGVSHGISLIVPLGISFYTFQAVGYAIDVYRGKVRAEKNFGKLALFVSFFPMITQGPILRFESVKDQLYARHEFHYQTFTFGLQRMVWGFFKKLVIAGRLAELYENILQNYADQEYCGVIIFIGVFLAGFHTYVDFSGGMDIVIGLSESLGIVLPENFRRPYLARTYSEFWRRWHISLGEWFKNYVFYPLSLSKAFNTLSKKCKKRFGDHLGKVLAPSLASFVTFFLIGIWHGANLKYVAYGIWQAFFVAQQTLFEGVYERMRKVFRVNSEKFSFKLFQILRTMLLVTIGRYFSFAENLADALRMLAATFTRLGTGLFGNQYYGFGLRQKGSMVMFGGILLIVIVDILQERGIRLRETIAKQNIVVRWAIYFAAVFAVLILGQYGPGYDAASFVYQGF
ncbi:MAG: hypothetical protein NC399_01640 [Muribaculum sp.]|nr:hypothetical protein [Muribaculum sp.]